MSYTELLIGCGNDKSKRVTWPDVPATWQNVTTLDWDEECRPDVSHDLNILPYPFRDNEFNEIHAYQCLEHTGRQGDARFFFSQFYEFWRMLKPGGFFVATVPMWDGPWAWGDPSHTRVIPKEALIFLNKDEYKQLGRTSMADYRKLWRGDFETIAAQEGDYELGFVLKARK